MSKDKEIDGDFCFYTGDQHKYFVFKTVEIYELHKIIDGSDPDVNPKDIGVILDFVRNNNLYVKKEYAILGCNCGSVIRKEVKQA